jgi:hypothetical protein
VARPVGGAATSCGRRDAFGALLRMQGRPCADLTCITAGGTPRSARHDVSLREGGSSRYALARPFPTPTASGEVKSSGEQEVGAAPTDGPWIVAEAAGRVSAATNE